MEHDSGVSLVGNRPVDEELARVQQLITLVQEQGVVLRLIGGLAIRLRCPSARHQALERSYSDVDFVAYKKQSRALREALATNGYTADRQFNAFNGERRLLFNDEAHNNHIDVFLDLFEMCHKLPLDQKLELHPLTLSPADLLLTKLQIVQMNLKDIQDILALLLDFQPVEASKQPGEELDVRAITHLCAQDWGWFTTVHDNLDRIAKEAAQLLTEDEADLVAQRTMTIKTSMINAPKSSKWRLRALAGRRIPWYELPEEVNR
ncbi:MAG TPA: DUF6036 family nucleotidyltransferase [Ktedonobacteraceae bacterium]|jgi:hypothetical protein